MNKAKKKSAPDRMRKEYDFSRGVRGKYAKEYAKGSNVVVLDPDVARLYPDAKSVNRALRAIAAAAPRPHNGK
ncbi:MAG TPA: hypothetical protein VM658_05075 [bacterium]|nr:hypothetical protein [bacterium]